MNAVVEQIDTGADLSATDPTGGSGTGEATGTAAAATSPAAAGAQDPAAATDGAGSDGQSADGTAAAAKDVGKDGKDKLVPLAALHEARETNKALKSQIAELQALPKLSADDVELLKTLKAQQKAITEPKDPDFLEDPKAYIDHQTRKAQDAVKELRTQAEQRTQQEQQNREVQQVLQATAGHESEFVKTTPDYYEAITHLRTVRAQQLAIWHPQATTQQIQGQIAQEELAGAAQALRAGLNPAEAAYKYAATFGYTKKAAAAATNGADKNALKTLGGGGGGTLVEEDSGNEIPEFAAALQERFGVKKKR